MSVSHEVSARSGTKLTYEHYCQFPEDGNRHEIIDGDHYMNPAPVPYHQQLLASIHFQLYAAVRVPGLGEVIFAPIDVQLSSHDVVQPDLVVVLKQNKIITASKIKGSPDLVVEILSPSTSQRDEGLKKQLYENSGVPEYWVVDPDEKVVRRFKLMNGKYGDAERCSTNITFDGLPNVAVDLTRVW